MWKGTEEGGKLVLRQYAYSVGVVCLLADVILTFFVWADTPSALHEHSWLSFVFPSLLFPVFRTVLNMKNWCVDYQ